MENSLKLPFRISSYEINPVGKSRLTTLANYFQEMAYEHANILEVGYDNLIEKNITWVLARMKIRVMDYPKWGEDLMIETWPHGVESVFGLRDYKIYNSDNKVLAVGVSCWMMINIETHRPIRITEDFINVINRTDSVFDKTPQKITLPDTMKPCGEIKVKYSDLDVVGHVNNVKYIEWCTDSMDPEIVLNSGVKDFEINFISESKLHDEIQMFSSDIVDNQIYMSAFNNTRKKESFHAIISI